MRAMAEKQGGLENRGIAAADEALGKELVDLDGAPMDTNDGI
jgi:hypothetical protein